MTEAIHKKQREADTLKGLLRRKKREIIITKHQTAQRLLKPLSVVNPYSPCLSYPTGSLRTRRDHKKYLNLIRAIAYLFQHQKEIKTVEIEGQRVDYIEVSLEDIDKANRLANEVLGQSLDELAPPSRALWEGIKKMVREYTEKEKLPSDQFFFNRRMIREYTGWTDWQIKAHIKQLEELEYLQVRNGAQGKQYSYVLPYKGQLDHQGKYYLNLTPVEEIRRLMKKKDDA
jgi:hypothetical protein